MIDASAELKKKMKTSRDFKLYADITLSDGTVLNLTPSNIMLSGCVIEDKTTDMDKFCIGSAIGKTLTFRIANYHDEYSSYDFYGSSIIVYESMQLENSIEKIKKGVFYVIVPQTPGSVIEISAVDGMYKFDRPYAANTVFPATLQSVISDCCVDCGIEIGFTQFDNYNFEVSNKPTDCTYRQIVSWVAQIAGYNARINPDGKLELMWYDLTYTEDTLNGGVFDGESPYATGSNADGGNFIDYSSGDSYDGGKFTDGRIVLKGNKSVSVSTDSITITGVSVKYDGTENIVGTDDYMIYITDNQLTKDKEQETAAYLGTRIIGITFRAFTAQILSNPLIEPSDTCYVVDGKGNRYTSLINYVSYAHGGYTTVACKAESPQKNYSTYLSQAAMAQAAANRNTTQKLSTYDSAVQNMNMLAMNAMGYFETVEEQSDGSRITYMHNKPALKESTTIYKRTSEGFFLSQDGGESYTAGFDSNGNAVLNILSAIGIVCDWIKGGTLTLGGLDDVNGKMSVLNANGVETVRADKDGIYASNGTFKGSIESKNAIITGGKININTDGTTSDYISLNYGDKKTTLSSAYLYCGTSSNYTVISDVQLYSKYGTSAVVSSSQGFSASYGSYNISIGSTGIYMNGNVYVSSSSIFHGKLSADSGLSVSGDISCTGKLSLGGRLTLTGGLTLETSYGSFSCAGDASFTGALSCNKAVTLSGTTTITGRTRISAATELAGDVKIGATTYSSLGFFGSTGNTRRSVSIIYSASSATASSNATKINEIINALNAYNLLG